MSRVNFFKIPTLLSLSLRQTANLGFFPTGPGGILPTCNVTKIFFNS